MGEEKRASARIVFRLGYVAAIMGIDGTWRRGCMIEDVSQTGAQISFDGSVEGLNLREFFLVLSRFGTAHRRCEMKWLNGNLMGLQFIKPAPPPVRR